MFTKNKAINPEDTSGSSPKTLFIIWLTTSLILTSVNYFKSNVFRINDFLSFLHFVAGFLGTFTASIFFGIVLGLIVMGLVWISKRNSDTAFEASVITAITINILLLFL